MNCFAVKMATYSTNVSRFFEFGRKIVGVGRNYKDHATELGNPIPEKPLLFMKPVTAYITQGATIKIPKDCQNLNHEVELGVVIGKKACNISEKEAMDCVAGYTVALDMTARDLQTEAKNKGHPWDIAKGFDTSCPVGEFISKEKIPDPHNCQLWCKVNGAVKQDGNTKDMSYNVPMLLSYISGYFTLEPGDLVLTGTPSGVSKVNSGDTIEAGIGQVSKILFKVE